MYLDIISGFSLNLCQNAVCLMGKLRVDLSGPPGPSGPLIRHEHLEANLQLRTLMHTLMPAHHAHHQ